ncbi:recombinase family protein [Labrenzia sp. R5_0]|nr:recombinase family protein [Labrenzia sp. R5_0]
MTRIAIYARYSTDLQSQASIEDQIRLCSERARADGGQIVQSYTDHALSGASLMRPGIQILMQDAAAGKFDHVYAEALDRLSRDQEDVAAVFKRLTFAGIKIITLAEGEVTELHIGLKGTMNAIFLKDLAAKTHRGLRGRVENGFSGGGKCFGYDVVGGEERGQRTINEQQASVVRRIFDEYAAGKSPKAIAAQLNKEGIAGPSGKGWGQSTINGNRQRGTGILNNELYAGRLVWNRLRYLKDPSTGKRVSKLNPESEWITQDIPELTIIDAPLWQKVKDRQGALNTLNKPFWAKQRPRNLFSGLVKCGCCGGGYSMISQTHMGCSNARNKGTCDNRKSIHRERLESDVLMALETHLMDAELCALFCEEYTRHMNKLRQAHNAAMDHHHQELEKVKRQLAQMVDAIANGAPVAPIKDKMHSLEARRLELEALLEDFEEAPPLLHPQMAKRYHAQVRDLIAMMNVAEHRAEAADIVRSLIEKIVLTPDESENRLVADLFGNLAGILAMSAEKHSHAGVNNAAIEAHKAALDQELPEETGNAAPSQDKLVAGAGFEPATFRL